MSNTTVKVCCLARGNTEARLLLANKEHGGHLGMGIRRDGHGEFKMN